MAGIQSKNTKPELTIRKGLFRQGLRYTLHSNRYPGRPDIAFVSRKAAVFVHGCYWHGHDCSLFKMPANNAEFWRTKFARNKARDQVVRTELKDAGWRQLVIWECAIRGKAAAEVLDVIKQAERWVRDGNANLIIRGR
jgi:DNA mismatch endonuclease (patch repair protein)